MIIILFIYFCIISTSLKKETSCLFFSIYMCICNYACIYVCVCVCMYMYVYIYIYIYIYMYACICICVCVCVSAAGDGRGGNGVSTPVCKYIHFDALLYYL